MEAKITKTSLWNWKDTKTFKTLEELQEFIKENGNRVVVTFREETNTWEVEIYDYYRE
jgi:hypothetical protein